MVGQWAGVPTVVVLGNAEVAIFPGPSRPVDHHHHTSISCGGLETRLDRRGAGMSCSSVSAASSSGCKQGKSYSRNCCSSSLSLVF